MRSRRCSENRRKDKRYLTHVNLATTHRVLGDDVKALASCRRAEALLGPAAAAKDPIFLSRLALCLRLQGQWLVREGDAAGGTRAG